jgi:hypothetical protein
MAPSGVAEEPTPYGTLIAIFLALFANAAIMTLPLPMLPFQIKVIYRESAKHSDVCLAGVYVNTDVHTLLRQSNSGHLFHFIVLLPSLLPLPTVSLLPLTLLIPSTLATPTRQKLDTTPVQPPLHFSSAGLSSAILCVSVNTPCIVFCPHPIAQAV